jgi:hypothetical protein
MSGSTPARQRTRSATLRAEAEHHADQLSSRGTIAWGSAVKAYVLDAMSKNAGARSQVKAPIAAADTAPDEQVRDGPT